MTNQELAEAIEACWQRVDEPVPEWTIDDYRETLRQRLSGITRFYEGVSHAPLTTPAQG